MTLTERCFYFAIILTRDCNGTTVFEINVKYAHFNRINSITWIIFLLCG